MSRLAALFGAPTPSLGVEISATRVAVVRLAPDGDPALVTGLAVEALPAGAVVPALNATNIADREVVSGAIRRGVQQLGGRGRRAVLVVPDTIAKVSLLRFDTVPTRAADLAALVSWQVRKSAPFPANQAQLSYVAGGPSHGDALLVNLAPDYLAVVILRDGQLMFYRHRGSDGEGSLADVVHQTAMYYEDRLGGRGFTRAILAGAGRARVAAAPEFAALDIDGVRRQLEARLGTQVEMIDPRPAVTLTDRIGTDAALLDTLAPVVGLLLRERAQ
jgi:Tfp pilus assembly PilM family ATPase